MLDVSSSLPFGLGYSLPHVEGHNARISHLRERPDGSLCLAGEIITSRVPVAESFEIQLTRSFIVDSLPFDGGLPVWDKVQGRFLPGAIDLKDKGDQHLDEIIDVNSRGESIVLRKHVSVKRLLQGDFGVELSEYQVLLRRESSSGAEMPTFDPINLPDGMWPLAIGDDGSLAVRIEEDGRHCIVLARWNGADFEVFRPEEDGSSCQVSFHRSLDEFLLRREAVGGHFDGLVDFAVVPGAGRDPLPLEGCERVLAFGSGPSVAGYVSRSVFDRDERSREVVPAYWNEDGRAGPLLDYDGHPFHDCFPTAIERISKGKASRTIVLGVDAKNAEISEAMLPDGASFLTEASGESACLWVISESRRLTGEGVPAQDLNVLLPNDLLHFSSADNLVPSGCFVATALDLREGHSRTPLVFPMRNP